MIEELNKNLNILELEKIKEVLPDYVHKHSKNMPPLTDSLNYLLSEEIKHKDNKASDGIIKSANFPFRKTLDDYDFSFQPSVSENQIRELKKQIHDIKNEGRKEFESILTDKQLKKLENISLFAKEPALTKEMVEAMIKEVRIYRDERYEIKWKFRNVFDEVACP